MLMSVMSHQKSAPVRRELQEAWSRGDERSARLGPEHRLLWAQLRDAAWGGKGLRPDLVLSVHAALGGSQSESAARAAAAVEMLHTAFVVHDDVIDGDDTRRGRPNVSGAFAAHARRAGASAAAVQRQGSAAGILAGDLALVSAMRLMTRSGVSAAQTEHLLELLEEAVHATASGELADVCLSRVGEGHALQLQDALRVSELKTSAYSFQLPMQVGAVLADAPSELLEQLSAIGRLVGIGFQLLDDLLGVFGSQELTGKTVVSDLREAKPTALLALARDTSCWEELSALIGDPELGEHQAARARDLLTKCGARSAVQNLAEQQFDEALELAARASAPAELEAVVAQLIERVRASAASAMTTHIAEGQFGAAPLREQAS